MAETTKTSTRGRAARQKTTKEPKASLGTMSHDERQRALMAARQHIHDERPTVGGGAGRVRMQRIRRKAHKILFFVMGNAPTEAEYTLANDLGTGVVFRNATKLVPGAPLENCDFVAGAVPDDYAAHFPIATGDDEITDGQLPVGILSRPGPTQGGGNNPDDMRPGTVDTGHSHASGTGSEKPGIGLTTPEPGADKARELQQAWRSGNTGV